MKIVTCTLPNASTLINGVAFSETPDGMVSEPVTAEVAAQFDSIPGYTVADSEPAKEPAKAPPKAPGKAPEAPKAPAPETPKE